MIMHVHSGKKTEAIGGCIDLVSRSDRSGPWLLFACCCYHIYSLYTTYQASVHMYLVSTCSSLVGKCDTCVVVDMVIYM